MGNRRERSISNSILRAIFPLKSNTSPEKPPTFFAKVLAFFSVFQLPLTRYKFELFKKLRNEVWEIDESEYTESFRSQKKSKKGKGDLISIGDLGYSGSTFFTTPDSKYLLKSLPRYFEQSFFRTRLLIPYFEHMRANPDSLLVRITDLLYSPSSTLGAAIGAAPSHHLVMENVLYGKSSCKKDEQEQWETYDLKPIDYFYPERDIAGGKLAPESVKERLVDEFPDKIRIGIDQKEELIGALAKDTELLKNSNAVDYSLFLVRYPHSLTKYNDIPTPPGELSPWRKGVVSSDGKWVYRAILLDFFWARDALQAHALSGLVKLWNLIKWWKPDGPMTITTTAEEYRERFLKMVEAITEVPDSAGMPSGEVRIQVPRSGSTSASSGEE